MPISMKPGRVALSFFLVFTSVVTLGQATVSASNPAERMSYRPSDPKTLSAFDHFYNLEYDQSVDDFGLVLQKHPDDPFALNHYIAAMLYR